MVLRLLRGALALILVGFPATTAAAQQETVHTIESEVLGETRTVTVHLPDGYEEQERFSYPVVYLLDGESNAEYAVAVADFLAESSAAPALITVAVRSGATRVRDYLPRNPSGDATSSGDADRFLDHIETELIPYIEARFRAAPLRLLSGHSMGGVFVTHAMITRPGLFQAHFAQSPYLTGQIAPPLLKVVEEALEPGPAGTFFFMNLGDEPELAPHFDRLREILAATAADGFEWAAEVEDGKTHMETRLVGHYDGIERFFAPRWRFPADEIADRGVAGLQAYIDRLNSAVGSPVSISQGSLQQAVQILFSVQDTDGAAAASALYVDYHPKSPIAHFLRANALAAGGARGEALRSVERAIVLYEDDPVGSLAPLYEAMKGFRTRLGGGDQ